MPGGRSSAGWCRAAALAQGADRPPASLNFCTLPDTVSGSSVAVVTITYWGTLWVSAA
jgi:hypothetical protein